MKILKMSFLSGFWVCLVLPHLFAISSIAQENNQDIELGSDQLKHKFIIEGGFGLGMYSAFLEDDAYFSPHQNVSLSLGYRLSKRVYFSVGMISNSEVHIQFTRDEIPFSYKGATTVFPLVFNFINDRPGATPVIGLGGYYQTDGLVGNNELTSGLISETGDFISGFGIVGKVGLAYNDYSFADFLFFKGAKYEISYNGVTDVGDFEGNFKTNQHFVSFKVALLL